MELTQLTKKRKEHIQSCKENNDRSHEIIAGLYSDPSHFIYELLQNADDAEASEVSFTLKYESLEFIHNGKKLFNFENVKSITTIGSSTKKDDINAIGTFGAGFKSVFAVTTCPQIHSGEYHFKIVDFIVPLEIDPIESGKKTIITLPFNHSELSNKAAYQQICQRFKALEAESLLFLKNIREIQWNTEEDKGHYLADIKSENAYILSQYNNEERPQEYLLFRKLVNIDSIQLTLAVTYLFDSEIHKIVPLYDTRLFVFFPTNERTGLKFLVHVPYKTTPSRESIPFSDEQNKILTKELSLLIAESILKIKEYNCLDVDFLSMLPIDPNEDHPIYKAAFDEVKQALLNKKIRGCSCE